VNTKTPTSGITIFEVLASIAILSIVLLISIATYRIWQTKVHVANARQELVSALTQAQQYAMASASEDSWGVHLEADRYVLFKGSFYNQSDPDNRVVYFTGVVVDNPDNTFADGAGGRIPNVVFAKYSGQTYNTGTITLLSAGGVEATRTINVLAVGIIE